MVARRNTGLAVGGTSIGTGGTATIEKPKARTRTVSTGTNGTLAKVTARRTIKPTAEQKARWAKEEPIGLTEMYAWLGTYCGLEPRQVQQLFGGLRILGCMEVVKGACEFIVPGFCRFYLHKIPGQKAGPMVNPITKETYIAKARKPSEEIRARVIAPMSGVV